MSSNEHDPRLEEAVAFALGSLDPDRVDDFKEHLKTCKRCQEELRWLAPAVRALPEAVEPQTPPPELKVRLMAEVRADVEAEERQAKVEERRERSAAGGGFTGWLDGLRLGGLTWKPLAGLALVILVVAGGIGYVVGNGGGGGGNTHTWELKAEENGGIAAKVVREGEKGEVHLAGLTQLPKGKVLEAWVEREGEVEAVPALFAPDKAGNASTTIENLEGVTAVMVTREPEGGSKAPTEKVPFVQVPLES
jgi:hypothetical protein